MNLLDQTRATPAANLALDEALLDAAEHDGDGEVLRFWEPPEWFVVVGYANHVATEVDPAACARDGVPILRRCSGGGTVLQGPGCLNYALVLRIEPVAGPAPAATARREARPPRSTATVPATNAFLMARHRAALERLLGQPVLHDGHTDLALPGRGESEAPAEPLTPRSSSRKFSGNSQRRRRQFLLFHGTFLLGLDLDRVERYLPLPSREPGYRAHRSHREFLVNLPLAPAAVKAALAAAWDATSPLATAPESRLAALVRDRYATDAWNRRF